MNCVSMSKESMQGNNSPSTRYKFLNLRPPEDCLGDSGERCALHQQLVYYYEMNIALAALVKT